MKINVEFTELKALVKTMGAEPVEWDSDTQSTPIPDFAEQLRKGIELDRLDDVVADENELLTYKGEQVLLYIKDTQYDEDTLLNRPEEAVRFHVADCQALDRMRSAGRFDRYVVTKNRTGSFAVDAKDENRKFTGTVEAELKVCKNCLKKIDYKGHSSASNKQKQDIWHNFSLDEFFENCQTRFRTRPTHTETTYPSGDYPSDWPQRASRYKRSLNHKCENSRCRVSLSQYPRLIDVHHRNGNKQECGIWNLKALCKECHRNAPNHQHYYVNYEDIELIRRVRREQGLKNPNPIK